MNGHLIGRRRWGFTLLEVMVGVAIVGLLVTGVYRFVASQLKAMELVRDEEAKTAAVEGFLRYFRQCLADLPVRTNDTLKGYNHLVRGAPADEIQLVCQPGHTLLTTAAEDGDYVVTITLQPSRENSVGQDLGIRRRMAADREENYTWLPLVAGVAALQFQYFQPQLGTWVERWEDSASRPTLVRVKFWWRTDEMPVEVIVPVPAARIQ
jgi:prepilin-type N-terminal cleavage/methylation domain-containing protein